jgi:ankyrin repeat protein
MLIKYFSFLILLLITVSCASSSDDGEEIMAVSFSQVGEALIKEALDTPEISSRLTSSSHAILTSIASKIELAMSFYDFAVQNYDFHGLGFNSEDPQYWNAFINIPFRKFSLKQADQAQLIIDKIVLPSHPFLSQVPFKLHTDDFLNQMILDIDTYLDKVAKDIFIQQFSQILALEDHSEAQILLKALLHKAKDTSFPEPEFKYHRAFLANVPFDYFKKINYCRPELHSSINSFISQLAPVLYYEIAEVSKQLADETLSGLLPSIYSTLTDTSYENTIGKYQESLLQPIDKSYLWDPQQFHEYLIEALPTLRIAENSNLPPYLKMLGFLADNSALAHLFRHYIAQSYSKPSDLSRQNQPLFWRSLIFSSFTDFSSIFPHISHQILQQLQLLPLSLDEVESLFVYGLLDDKFSSYDHFHSVSEWGHISTVKLLLRHRTDIFADHAGMALQYATKGGHIPIVKLLLNSRDDIHADDLSCALYIAAESGYTLIVVELMLLHRTDITSHAAASALCEAAQNGFTPIVEIILHNRTDISSDHAGCALLKAVECGHTSTVEILLQHRSDILAAHVGKALLDASKSGYISIVELLLHSRTYISTYNAGCALLKAVECGHTRIVERLLLRRTDILAYDIGSALCKAAQNGFTQIVELLLHNRINISTNNAGRALIEAAKGGHASTVDCILQHRTDIFADDVGFALCKAAESGHTLTVGLFLHSRTDIFAIYAGSALCKAAKSGHAPIVELLLHSRTVISADDVGSALCKAKESGHNPIVELLRQHQLNTNL